MELELNHNLIPNVISCIQQQLPDSSTSTSRVDLISRKFLDFNPLYIS